MFLGIFEAHYLFQWVEVKEQRSFFHEVSGWRVQGEKSNPQGTDAALHINKPLQIIVKYKRRLSILSLWLWNQNNIKLLWS